MKEKEVEEKAGGRRGRRGRRGRKERKDKKRTVRIQRTIVGAPLVLRMALSALA